MGNVGIYSVGTESVYQIVQSSRTECFAGVSREGLTRETQLSPSCPDFSHSSMCKSHESLREMLSREIPVKTLQSSFA